MNMNINLKQQLYISRLFITLWGVSSLSISRVDANEANNKRPYLICYALWEQIRCKRLHRCRRVMWDCEINSLAVDCRRVMF